MTGLRPNRSDNAPITGEQKNCINAQTVPKSPYISAERTVSPPKKLLIRFGKTGMTIPIASMSRTTVTKTKVKAAVCDLDSGVGESVKSVFLIRVRYSAYVSVDAVSRHNGIVGDTDNDFEVFTTPVSKQWKCSSEPSDRREPRPRFVRPRGAELHILAVSP